MAEEITKADTLHKSNHELYITLIRTFGLISVTIPLVLFFVNEFMFEPSLVGLMGVGFALIIASVVWSIILKRSQKQSEFVE